jgi:hypothetical protein
MALPKSDSGWRADTNRFRRAWRTLQGIEAVHMIRKGRARRVSKGDSLAQQQFIDELFGLLI